MERPHRIGFTGAALCLVAAALPPTLEAQRDRILPVRGDVTLHALQGQTSTVVSTHGREEPVGDVAAGARVEELQPLSDGWVMSLAEPAADGLQAAVLQTRNGRQQRLPGLPRFGRLQLRASPLIDNQELRGLAWLEGDDIGALRVRHAAWRGADWGPATTVAEPATGSQMALQAVELPGDRSLLVWSRFDGTDDEIVYSMRDGESWTPARLLYEDNDVPDVLPQLLSRPQGDVLAAWSRATGGHYHVYLSRFESGVWSRPHRLPGRGGRVLDIVAAPEGTLLLYSSADPALWNVVRLDSRGVPDAAAAAPRDGMAPPLLQPAAAGVRLIWPDTRTAVDLLWEQGS